MVEDEENQQDTLARIIYIQHTDITTYDSVNLDDPISTQSYYKKIYQPFSMISEEESDRKIENLMNYFKMRTEKGSKLCAEVQAQKIMRSAAEKVHDAFRELNRDSFAKTAILVLNVLSQANIGLAHLEADCINEEYADIQTPSS